MQKVSLTELRVLANEVLAKLPAGPALVTLSGELGAGKTTFVQALAKELGVAEPVQSPTYVLMKSYTTTNPRFKKLIHIDLYRLEKPEEFSALKSETFLGDGDTLVCVEWPEKAGGLLPTPTLAIRFSSEDAHSEERNYDIS